VVVLAASLAFVIYWSSTSTPKTNGSGLFEVKKSNFTRKITQAGELRALNSARILAPRDGTITYLIPEGTIVKAGDVVVRFDPSDYQRVLDENTAALRVAQADYRKAQKDVEVEREKQLSELARLQGEIQAVDLELGQMERKRGLLRELADKGFITKSTFEENELTYLKTKIKLEQAKVALGTAQRNSKPALESIQAGAEKQKANVQKAEQLIANARADLKDAEVRASQAGLVVYAQISSSSPEKIHEGLVTFRRRTLLYLPDVSNMVVETEINEIDVREVKEGGPVNITLEAYPGEIFQGKVLQIGSLARRKREASGAMSRIKVFDVTVAVEEKDPRLKPGLTATVDIIVDRQKDVIAIPTAAVRSEKGGEFVFVSTAGKVEKRKVVLGPNNENSVVVTQGLTPGELIILGSLPPPS
jgi:HlyD family secretion protein